MRGADDRRPVSERVVAAVGSELDANPLDLTPLQDAVDADAIDALFPIGGGGSGDPVREFAFTYEGFEVRVAGDGTVDLSPAGADSSREQSGSRARAAPPGSPDAPD